MTSTVEASSVKDTVGKSSTRLKLALLVTIVATGIVVFRYTPVSEYVSPEPLKAFFESIRGFWWAPVVYILFYAVGTLFAFPGLLLTVLGGVTFGTAKGTLYVILGSNLGASLAFGLARWLGRDFVARHVKGPMDRVDRQLRNQGFLRVLQLRLIPLVPFNMLNYACGLSGVRYLHYLFASLIGMLPGIFVYVYSAAALGQLYFAGAGVEDEAARAALRETALTNAGIALSLLVLVSLAPYLYRRLTGRSGPQKG